MIDWYIRLIGEEFDLKIISNIFKSKELNISEREGGHYLYNKNYCNIKNHDEVFKESENLINTINGIAKMLQNDFKPIKTQSIMFYDKDGNRNSFVNLSVHAELRSAVFATAHVMGKDGKEKRSTEKNFAHSWLEVANKDEHVKRALWFISSKDLDWNILYKIFEIIEPDVRKSINQWASKSLIKNFKHTANSYSVLGDKARHGYENTKPPKNPISFEEAKALIINILTYWLNSKIIQKI